MPDADRRCPQCGEPYAPADHPKPCARCGTVLPPRLPTPPAEMENAGPKPLDIETWFREPIAPQTAPPADPPKATADDRPAIEDPLDLTPHALPADEPEPSTPPPPPGDELIVFDEPPVPPPAPETETVPVARPASRAPAEPPVARVAPVASDPPRVADLPEARPAPSARPVSRREPRPGGLVRPPLPPVREDGPPEVPKPRIVLALLVLLAVLVAGACAVTVIAYALWAGFRTVARPKPEPHPAPVVAPKAGPAGH